MREEDTTFTYFENVSLVDEGKNIEYRGCNIRKALDGDGYYVESRGNARKRAFITEETFVAAASGVRVTIDLS